MPTRYLVLVMVVDLLTLLAVFAFLMRVTRRGAIESPSLQVASHLAAAVAIALLLVALPLPWTQAPGDDMTTLTGSLGSSLVVLTAVTFSAVALALGMYFGPRSGRAIVGITDVVLGTGWALVALDSLLLTWGLNQSAVGSVHVAAGRAVWLCLLGGLMGVAAGCLALQGSPPDTAAVVPAPPAPTYLDEWGVPRSLAPRDTEDEW